jgi:hypothetical protein
VRASISAVNTLGVAALATFVAGCSGGSLQIPASNTAASALGQAPGREAMSLRRAAPNPSHGFMQPLDAETNLVYMSSWGTASVVDVFTTSGKQVGQISNGLVEPQGLFVDAASNLWVANMTNVLVYPHGGLSPSRTLADPVGAPIDVTVCPNGTAYVADFYDTSNSNHASIQIYAGGSTTPTGTLDYTTVYRNQFLTCDRAGNVFAAILIGESVGDGRVIEFPLGQEAGAKEIGITLQSPGGIKPNDAGNLLVTDLVAHTIAEYTENGSPTGLSIATGVPIEGIALSRNGKTVLGADPGGPNGLTWSFPEGKQERVYTCCSSIGPPIQNNFGVAFYPGQKGI